MFLLLTDLREYMKRVDSSHPEIPEDCLGMLYKLVELIERLIDELYNLCINENSLEQTTRPYSSLSQDPTEWEEPGPSVPCNGEFDSLSHF